VEYDAALRSRRLAYTSTYLLGSSLWERGGSGRGTSGARLESIANWV
jgi:hypothetical protein